MANLRTRSGSTPQPPTSTAGRRAQRGANQANAGSKAAPASASARQTSQGPASSIPTTPRGKLKKVTAPVAANHSTTDPALLDPIDEQHLVALQPIVEEVNGSRHVLPPVDEEEHQHYAEAVPNHPDGVYSPGNRSTASGTTAITAYSQQAIRDLLSRKEELLKSLPEFYGMANDMLRVMAPINITTEEAMATAIDNLYADGSREMQKLLRRRPDFEEVFQEFAHAGHFINRDVILRSLLEMEVLDMSSAGPGRPDDLLFKANLAELMYMLTVGLPEQDRMLYLQQLDDQFPLPFLAKLGADAISPGGSFLTQMCFEASMAIKVQLVIARAQSEGETGQDAESIVADVFGLDQQDPNGPSVKQWSPSIFMQGDGRLPVEFDNLTRAVVRSFGFFTVESEGGTSIDITSLSAARPWLGFLHTIGVWAACRNSELEQNISKKGGADFIVENLRVGNYKRPKLPAGSLGVGGARALSKIKHQRRSNARDKAQKLAVEDGGPTMLEHSQIAGPSNAQKGSWLDEQEGATSVHFDTQEPQTVGDVSQDLGYANNAVTDASRDLQRVAGEGQIALGKRPMAIMDQQAGPGPSPRPLKKRRMRKSKPVATEEDLAANQFAEEERNAEEDITGLERLEGTPPATAYTSTGERAKQFTQKARGAKEPQRRKQWTDEETNALLWYVERYGSKWAEIMKADNGLHFSDRGQVALKDKARNIIRNAYKSGEPIPRGLEDYNLPENMKAELRALGIDI